MLFPLGFLHARMFFFFHAQVFFFSSFSNQKPKRMHRSGIEPVTCPADDAKCNKVTRLSIP